MFEFDVILCLVIQLITDQTIDLLGFRMCKVEVKAAKEITPVNVCVSSRSEVFDFRAFERGLALFCCFKREVVRKIKFYIHATYCLPYCQCAELYFPVTTLTHLYTEWVA